MADSGDQIRLIKSPPQPETESRIALGKHTDFGSITILFNQLGGLQILPPGEDPQWTFVRPLPGHCIVNLGDAMVRNKRIHILLGRLLFACVMEHS